MILVQFTEEEALAVLAYLGPIVSRANLKRGEPLADAEYKIDLELLHYEENQQHSARVKP